MCRLAAYAGPSRPLSSLIYDGSHALERQAYVPRELIGAHVNVDGTGVAWWPEPDQEPVRFVTDSPPWADDNLADLASKISAPVQIAAVRSATPGIPFGPANVAPFTRGDLALAHNGRIEGFRGAVGQHLIGALEPDVFADLFTINDSRALFLHVSQRFEAGASLRDATLETLDLIGKILADSGGDASLNIVVGDGRRMVATRYSIDAPQNSLYWLASADGVTVASEPLDEDPDWQRAADDTLIEFTAYDISITPLKDITA